MTHEEDEMQALQEQEWAEQDAADNFRFWLDETEPE